MESGKLDLRPLDPSRDEAAWERLIGRITERARSELARRSSVQSGVLGLVGNWAWPALAAAGLAAILSGAAFALTRERVQAAENTAGIVHFLGVAEPVAEWLDADRSPSTSDLVAMLEGGGQ